MDKYDYVTTTIEEEKERIEKIVLYLKNSNENAEDLIAYKERYNNILKYIIKWTKFKNLHKSRLLDNRTKERVV